MSLCHYDVFIFFFFIILNYKKKSSSPLICDRHIAHTHSQRTRRGIPRLSGGSVASPNRYRVCLRIERAHKAAPVARCSTRVPGGCASWRRRPPELAWSMRRRCPTIRPPALCHYAAPPAAQGGSAVPAGCGWPTRPRKGLTWPPRNRLWDSGRLSARRHYATMRARWRACRGSPGLAGAGAWPTSWQEGLTCSATMG